MLETEGVPPPWSFFFFWGGGEGVIFVRVLAFLGFLALLPGDLAQRRDEVGYFLKGGGLCVVPLVSG